MYQFSAKKIWLLFFIFSLNLSYVNAYRRELLAFASIAGVVGGIVLYNYIQEKRESERMNSRSTEEIIYDCQETYNKHYRFYKPYLEKFVDNKKNKNSDKEFVLNMQLVKYIQTNYYKLSESPSFWEYYGSKYPLLTFVESNTNRKAELEKQKLWLDKKITQLNLCKETSAGQLNKENISVLECQYDLEKYFETLINIKKDLDNLLYSIDAINNIIISSDAYKIEQLTYELEIAKAQRNLRY